MQLNKYKKALFEARFSNEDIAGIMMAAIHDDDITPSEYGHLMEYSDGLTLVGEGRKTNE